MNCAQEHTLTLVVTSGNGRAMLWAWSTGIDASLLLNQSASILRFSGNAEAGHQSAILSVLRELCPEAHARAGGLLRRRTSCVSDMLDMNRCESTFASIYIDSEVQWKCGGRTSVCDFVRAS